jgi:diadenosine tetraphosphate (Ap4A) HIT family hydrolase
MSKVKILLVGSVGENVPVLRKKLKVLNASKAGPFDACFCVGSIHLGDDTTSECEAFPIPVYLQYVVKGKAADSSVAAATTSCCEQGIVSLGGENTNLYHLRGSSSNINQLRMFQIKLGANDPLMVASCPRHIRASTSQQQQQQQCDILLSPDWPQGMEDILNVDTEPLSYDVAEVALSCRPRYHVCPSSKLYHVSPPYHLPKSDHVGRFLALGPVTKEKKTPKTHKFIHALGLVPLASNPGPTTAPSTLPCPFGAAAGTPSSAGIQNNSNNATGSAAVPKFAMKGEAYDAAYSRFGANNKRTRDNNNNSNSNNFSLEPPEDPTISTLFLYGLHKDVTGELQSTRSPKVLLAFGKHGVTRVRHPPNVPTSTYCFLEFPSQKEAAQCLQNCHGRITIDSVNLTLKWATPPKQNNDNNKRQRRDDRHLHQQHFVTQAEAKDSTTLFFHPPKDTKLERSDNGNNTDKNSSSSSSNAVEKQDGVDSTTGLEEKPSIANAEKKEPPEQTDATMKESSDVGSKNEEERKATVNDTAKVTSEDQEVTPRMASKDETDKVEGTETTATTEKDEKAESTNAVTKSGPPSDEGKDKTAVNNKATGFAGSLQNYVQKVLEDSLNEGVENEDERVTAETEPALQVEVRCKEQYGFLEFASNAAATMALAAITKSTDGGLLIAQPEGVLVAPSSDLVGTTLRWAKGSSTGNKKRNANKGGRDEVLEALGLKRQYYPADGRTDCWFCLSSSTCETHLITGVYDEWYTAMPKGPVHPGHILLVPVKHTREGAWTLNQEWVGLLEKVQEHASSTYDADLFVFERAMATRGGYHTHIQCVPIPRDASTRLQSTMMAHAKASGFELRPIQSDLGVKAIIEKNDSYFYAEIRTRMHVHRFLYRRGADEESSSTVPLQFAREVLASVLNNSKLAHWKACVVDKEQETQLASDFRASFNGVAPTT